MVCIIVLINYFSTSSAPPPRLGYGHAGGGGRTGTGGGRGAAGGGGASAGRSRSCVEGGSMWFLDLLSFIVVKKFIPDFISHLRDRVLKQLVKNLVFTFEYFSREKSAVLLVVV